MDEPIEKELWDSGFVCHAKQCKSSIAVIVFTICLFRAAWKNLGDMPQDQAKLLYVENVLEYLGEPDKSKETIMGPVVSTMGEQVLEHDADVPVGLLYLFLALQYQTMSFFCFHEIKAGLNLTSLTPTI